MATRLIGERVARKEDRRLVTGRGQYLDDIEIDGMLHAAVLRSTHAHAHIRDLDVLPAFELPGVHAVYTHEDLGPLDRPLPLGIPNAALHHPVTQLPLARDEVFLVGQPIALVVAETREQAEDAVAAIVVDYEPLPVVPSVQVALEGEALVHADVPGNLAADFTQTSGDPEKALKAAPHVIERELWVERGAGQPLETRGVIADWNDAGGHMQVWDSTQAPTTIRSGIAGFFGLGEHQVHVTAPDIGGGFGTKIAYWYPEELLIPFASRQLCRPVKWVEDRLEHFVGSNHERGQLHQVKFGFDDEGHILALDDRFVHDAGAFVPYGIIVPIVTASRVPGTYKIPNYHSEFRVVYTNTVPSTPWRGAGQPQAIFVIERVIDLVARHLGLDRAEVRRRNFIQPDEFPYQPGPIDEDGEPAQYDSGNYPALLEKALDLIRADDVAGEQAAAIERGKRIGIGFGAYTEITGGELYEGVRVTVEPSGRVFVALGVSSQGQGHQTILAQICAETLGVPIEDVEVRSGDTRQFRWGVGTFASRIGVIAGNATAQAAGIVREKAAKIAAELLEAAPEDIDIVDGMAFVKGAPAQKIPLRELAVVSNPLRVAYSEEAQAASQFAARPVPAMELLGGEPGLEAEGYHAPPKPSYASGCHAAVVEVDPETFEVKILRYAAVHDCGRVINPMLVEGQVFGGVAQGIGGGFFEKMHYDDAGQLVNGTFMDYLIPFASEVPEIAVGHVETPSPLNPLGLKGAGEAGVIPGAATIVGAIEHALDMELLEAPLSPDRLFALSTKGGK
jgi:aerobic carbon-monoxide dehydrogenase large subunit